MSPRVARYTPAKGVTLSELSHNAKRRVYRVLVRVAGSDGDVHPLERAILERVAEAYEITAAEIEALESESPDSAIQIGTTEAEHRALARGMVQVAAADGVLEGAEGTLLRRLGEAVGLRLEVLDAAIAKALEQSQRSAVPGVVIGVFLSGDLPDATTRDEVLDAAVAALQNTRRWGEVVKANAQPLGREAIEVQLEAMEHPAVGAGHSVTLRLLDAEGEEQEAHSSGVLGDGEGIPETVGAVACHFANPEAKA